MRFGITIIYRARRPAVAQPRPDRAGAIEGVVTTQGGTIRLGGAQVVVRDATNQEMATILSDGTGAFRITALPEGKYTLTASLDGFSMAKASVVVTADGVTQRSFDLPIATVTQTVELMAPTSIVSSAETLGSAVSIYSR